MWFFNRPFGIKTFLKILAALAGFLFLFLFSSSVSYPLPPGLGSFQGADAPIAQEAIPEQPFTYPVSFLNDRARDITGAAAVNAPGFIVPGGLTGEGQIVAIADSGLDIGSTDDIHPDLKSRPGKMPKIVLLKSWAGRDVPDDPDGHGTHMAATIAGTGAASDGKFKGVAPGASIYFQAILNKDGDIDLPGNLYDLFWPAYSAGARIHVDAWGGGPDTYLKSAAQVDEFVRNHPDFLVIFGAGNSGPSSATLTSEANSKNALAVGASILPRPAFVPGANNTSAAADLSSRGPAGDGRIKPELLVPASAVISAKSRLVEGNLQGFPDYTQMQGTSMAAAVAGGSSAIVREYLKKYMNLATPSAALVKSALINGARSAQGGPSKEGFGIIDLAGTLIALKEGSIHLADEWAGVTQGNEVVYTLHVSDSNAPLKATLAWTDPPVEPGSGRTLVNDLDLIVKTPDGRVYYGNHFLGQNTPDRTNNVEQVYLPAPVPGDYTVRVAGAAVQQNTVRAGTTVAQDFALAWGRTPVESMMTRGDNRSISLANGSSFSPADVPVVNLIDDSIAPSDAEHFFPGAEVFRAPDRAYIITRLWRAAGVKVLKTAAGFVFTEINLAVRLGGYNLAPDEGGVLLNNYAADPDKIPPGVEVSAVINPREQNIRQVRASYIKKEGVVLAVDAEEEEKTLTLAGDEGTYRVSPTAVYSYEDTYTSAETADAPFGTGALEELKDVLPGMPVSLQLAPSSGDIQYLTVKRNVALGTVYKTVASTGEIILENGDSYKIFPGAMVKRDRETCSFEAVKPGDHVSAVLLPDTGEVIGLVAFSKVLYGRVIDFSSKNRTVYLLDDNGRYHSFGLPGSAVIYRWGVRATANTIAVGGRVRVVTDPAGQEVWRLDLAETLFDKSALLKYNGAGGVITTSQGVQYRLSGSTRFYKNGCPALPEDLLPGEQLELEYTAAPFPAGNVLFTVNCRSAAPPPALLTSIVTLDGRLVLTGRTGTNTKVYIWRGDARQAAPVDESGRFNLTLPLGGEGEYNLFVEALNRQTGGITGRQISITAKKDKDETVLSALKETIEQAGKSYLPDAPLARAEAAAVLARFLNWPALSDSPLPFSDINDIPAPFRSAVAEARARGIFKGYSGCLFLPLAGLSRAEAAVVFASVLRELGLDVKTSSSLPYTDAAVIPAWAASAVAETAAAGIFQARWNGAFAPGDSINAAEMAAALKGLLEYCETEYAGKQPG